MSEATYHLTTASRAEIKLLESLASEFPNRVKISQIDTHKSTQVTIQTDSPHLRNYIYWEAQQLKLRVDSLEKNLAIEAERPKTLSIAGYSLSTYKQPREYFF